MTMELLGMCNHYDRFLPHGEVGNDGISIPHKSMHQLHHVVLTFSKVTMNYNSHTHNNHKFTLECKHSLHNYLKPSMI